MKITKILIVVLSLFSLTARGIHFTPNESGKSRYDLTIVGQVLYRDSLGRFPITFSQLFKDELNVNFIPSGIYDLQDVPLDIQALFENPDKRPGNVTILFDILGETERIPALYVPDESLIKIAYSMLESTAIPDYWVRLLNEKFDAVVVPDEYYKNVYIAVE